MNDFSDANHSMIKVRSARKEQILSAVRRV